MLLFQSLSHRSHDVQNIDTNVSDCDSVAWGGGGVKLVFLHIITSN